MGWDITVLDEWGINEGLGCNIPFMNGCFATSPTWDRIFHAYNPKEVNDGNKIPMKDIEENREKILSEVKGCRVESWFLRMFEIIDKYKSYHDDMDSLYFLTH